MSESAATVQPTVEVMLDDAAYSADAIQRAAYRLGDRLSIELEHEPPSYRCRLFSRAEISAEEAGHLFRQEVLDEVLRERIREETGAVRNTILSLAFSKVDLDEAPEPT